VDGARPALARLSHQVPVGGSAATVRKMLRRSHRARVAGVVSAFVLAAAIAAGWGLPVAGGELTVQRFAAQAERVGGLVADEVVAVAAPAIDTLAPRPDHGTLHERVRDLLAAATGALALLLLVAHRRRRAFALPRVTRMAVVAHGGRAPPV
jgi:hypothetical protein